MFQPNFPPFDKIGWFNGGSDAGTEAWDGLYYARETAKYIDNYCDLRENAEILDFGCGSMRVSRFLVQLVPQFKWSACDVNPFSIEWAKTAFGNRANIFLSNAWPPLPVADQSFDVVFAWSIFSHYSEAAHRAWLEEMHRVLRSNGYLLLSFQSDYLLDRMLNEDMIERTRSQGVDLKVYYLTAVLAPLVQL